LKKYKHPDDESLYFHLNVAVPMHSKFECSSSIIVRFLHGKSYTVGEIISMIISSGNMKNVGTKKTEKEEEEEVIFFKKMF